MENCLSVTAMDCIQTSGPSNNEIRINAENSALFHKQNNWQFDKFNCAVYLKNVCKSFGNQLVLRNFCMNVKKGQVYGLLGPSGCGKTTMLSCVVGMESWEQGEILVFGKKPGSKGSDKAGKILGYMPQELALYRYLTIREIIQLYGKIYGMTNSKIEERWQFLKTLLQLPVTPTLIGYLSGGQKRRVSLAVAMLHRPQLLVLDEPTSGVDPLLRRNIWEHLYNLVKTTGVTVIITTHYIEEARFSDTIGVIRKGRLLIEDSPNNIYQKYNCQFLEEAVLCVCREDELNKSQALPQPDSNEFIIREKYSFCLEKNRKRVLDNGNVLSSHGTFKPVARFDTDKIPGNLEALNTLNSYGTGLVAKKLRNHTLVQAINRIMALAQVMVFTMMRNPVYLGSILLIPAIQGIITLMAFTSKPRGMHLGIVNHELGNWTTECGLPRHSGNSCELTFLSCQYLNQLVSDDLVVLDSYDSEREARSQVHARNLWGYLVFPETFSQHTVELAAYGQFAKNESIEGSRIHAHLDLAEFMQAFFIRKHLFTSYLGFMKRASRACHIEGQFDSLPMHFKPPVYGKDEDDFSDYVIPSGVLLSLFAVGIMVTGISHVADRKEGTVTRARAAGLAPTDVISAHMITQLLITFLQLIIWNGILYFLFNFDIVGSCWLWLMLCILVEMCGALSGLFLGQILKDESQVMFFCIFIYGFFLFFGCVFLPVERMPKFWQFMCHFCPTFLPSGAARSVVVRGLGLGHPLVWPGMVSILGWILGLTILVVIVFEFSRK